MITLICSRCQQEQPRAGGYISPHGLILCKDCFHEPIQKPRLVDGKFCRTCGQEKLLSEFHQKKSGVKGTTSDCKVCRQEKSKAELERGIHRSRDFYRSNQEKREKDKQRLAAYRQSAIGKEAGRIKSQQYRARKLALPDQFTVEEWRFCLSWWKYVCAYCGSQKGFWNPICADHFIPLKAADCPGTVIHNILPACRSCNSKKGKWLPDTWLAKEFGKPKAAMLMSRIRQYFEQVANRERG